jgi:hypothetical protein
MHACVYVYSGFSQQLLQDTAQSKPIFASAKQPLRHPANAMYSRIKLLPLNMFVI